MVGVIYCRVSTKEQVQNMSLTTQQRACMEYCERNGIEVLEVFVDEGESAKTTDRPEFQRLLAYCREQRGRVQHVVVYSINRFARNQHDHVVIRALLKGLGVTLRSVTEPITDTATGRMVEGVLAVIAEFDNNVRAERTIEGMRAALREGRWTFVPPIGYRRVLEAGAHATIAPDPDRAPLVRLAFELMATGRHTKRDVLTEVTRQGLVTARNAPVSPQTFQQMLRNPIYCGWLTVPKWGEGRWRGDFEPIVDEALFNRVQAILDGRSVHLTPYKRNHPDFPLRCFVRCGLCDTPLTGSWSRARSKRYAYYRCRCRDCGAVNVRTDELERRFLAYVDGLAPRDEYLAFFEQVVLDVWRKRREDAATVAQRLERQVADLRAKKTRLIEAGVYRKLLDDQTFREHMDVLNERLALADLALHDAHLDEVDTEGLVAFAKTILAQPSRFWMEATLDQRQRLQRFLFPAGVTYEGGTFGTTETSLIYRMLRLVDAPKESEASPTGFEPVLPA
jgi:site-specific DNA recombinase